MTPLSATKYSAPPATVNRDGSEEAAPRLMSSGRVPAAVPSVTHNSLPVDSSKARKKTRPSRARKDAESAMTTDGPPGPPVNRVAPPGAEGSILYNWGLVAASMAPKYTDPPAE